MPTTITFFPVDNGDMTLIKFGDLDATTLLIDVNIRQDADDPDGDARDVAKDALGEDFVDSHFRPRTASEDFAYLLQARPGSFLFLGNGESASLHNPRYDFNDAILAPAAAYWVHLAERYLVP